MAPIRGLFCTIRSGGMRHGHGAWLASGGGVGGRTGALPLGGVARVVTADFFLGVGARRARARPPGGFSPCERRFCAFGPTDSFHTLGSAVYVCECA